MPKLKTVDGLRVVTNEKECWEWVGNLNQDGYGTLTVGESLWYAHRLSYILFKGAIRANMEIDHLCRNPKCCNPAHLEMVTSRENSIRGAHPNFALHKAKVCKKGHLIKEGNILKRSDGRARCKECSKHYPKRRSA